MDKGLLIKNSVEFSKKLKLLLVSRGNIFGSDPIIKPIRMINVCFLKLFNKYLITLEKIITPSENPSPNTAINVIEPISVEKSDILLIKNSYVPSMIKIYAPDIPGKIIAKEQIIPHKKIYQFVIAGSNDGELKIIKLIIIEKINKIRLEKFNSLILSMDLYSIIILYNTRPRKKDLNSILKLTNR